MPHVFASISNLARSDPQCAVQVLSFIQDMLPSVATLNNLVNQQQETGPAAMVVDDEDDGDGPPVLAAPPSASPSSVQPQPHYAWVESDHPYKAASVNNYRVAFPDSVQWMSVEFDPRCGTAQMEDTLQIYIK